MLAAGTFSFPLNVITDLCIQREREREIDVLAHFVPFSFFIKYFFGMLPSKTSQALNRHSLLNFLSRRREHNPRQKIKRWTTMKKRCNTTRYSMNWKLCVCVHCARAFCKWHTLHTQIFAAHRESNRMCGAVYCTPRVSHRHANEKGEWHSGKDTRSNCLVCCGLFK